MAVVAISAMATPGSLIGDRARIGHLLMRLAETRAPLAVSLAGSPRLSTSLLLAVDFKSGEIVLDEPFPALAMAKDAMLGLRGRVDGSTVEFETRLRRQAAHAGASALFAALPQQLRHHERRGSYRVQIPQDLYLPPTMFTSREGAFRGRLLDISESGAGSLVTEMLPPVGGTLACALSLPGTRLIADAQVCSAAGTASGEPRRLGLRFAGLNAQQQNAMSRAVAHLDRQLLRRYASATWV